MGYGIKEELEERGSFFSKELRIDHFRIYKTYVQHVNSLLAELDAMRKDGRGGSLLYQERSRRLGFELNGKIFHELYFENLSDDPCTLPSRLERALVDSFGSIDGWKEDFSSLCMSRGNGWCVLYFDPESSNLFNGFVESNHISIPIQWVPLMVVDLWEHAYLKDFGAHGRENFLRSVLMRIDYQKVEERLLEHGKFG